ncbi:cytochrome bd-I oxidase subunit CydX [Roseibium aggregatum]|nr:cytochrome bd-I oxidase subunit CydX [Roseibium aggregatum]
MWYFAFILGMPLACSLAVSTPCGWNCTR